ncbi:FMN-dependent alpha-hydroxy acid dehydrogenase [Saitoella complicata NRRL Y-17804]|uniref:FMN hydroxy acid dehydrogenase domain-containing protein n=1 Tax=Saitoella complicata (strain BCRC 22490 / CBS 7301 / JCM 7358 / NBRC 10748 / NRRL Y-17804) TaxID=698492 RepID=A0A0E9NRE6_SAICN|nr:FMN-dependent alpha-hydroxy acid dehydrogenase [Saitoella complicata NRRL Y-17804]ODQ50779.1 FMN-dependent alpha-hydroxy acid dehydrogenase [Saitoella complicata NRRL Y-17804]GAO51995.1 hypothetical protein G7K_6083-t1 [Saitoella complicata NRRL Y-17804]
MSDPYNLPKRTTPHWGLYQRKAFIEGTKGILPPFNTDPGRLEDLAHEKLSAGGWFYASSNAGSSLTHRANREAFYRYKILPRMLRETNTRDTTTELFGHKISAPIMFAPVGINKIYHPTGELSVAKVAGELNLPYCLSTAGSQSIEDVAAVNGNGPRFYQLYMPHDDELTISLLTRAHQSGFDVCMMTLDTWQLAWRHDDVATANYAFYYGIGAELGLSDPIFQKRLKEWGIDPKKDPQAAGRRWIDNVWHGKAHTWDRIPWVRDQWQKISGGRPFLLKGIQTVDDAKKALEYGCDGIVVSNHAGRQVDGAIGSLDALAEICKELGSTPNFTILFDSGVRSASDIFKAIALGAKAVMTGRLWIWGLSIQGEFGVRHVMKSLLADFDILMNVAGYPTIKDIDRKALKWMPYGSSYSEGSKL